MRASGAVLVSVLLLIPAFSWTVAPAEELGWAGRLGGAGYDEVLAAAVDAAGGVYLAGHFSGTADFDPGPGVVALTAEGTDAFVARLDSGGRLLWVVPLGGAGVSLADAVAVDPDDHAWVVGRFAGTADFDPGPGAFPLVSPGATQDGFVWELGNDGQLLWAGQVSGPGNEEARRVAIGPFGTVHVAGWFEGTADVDPGKGVATLASAGNEDAFVLKLDAGGGFLWAGRLGGTGVEEVYGITVGAEGRVWTVGRFSATADFDPGEGSSWMTPAGEHDGFLSELDREGRFLSAGRIGGTGSDRYKGIAPRGARGVYLVGMFSGTADLDPGPGTDLRVSAGGTDLFVTALEEYGQPAWTRTAGGPSEDTAEGLAVDAAGEVWAVGTFRGTVDFDPGGATFPLEAASQDGFAWKLDAGGGFRWAGRFGGEAVDRAWAIAPRNGGGVWVGGDYLSGTADVDPGPASFPLANGGNFDAYAARLDRCAAMDEGSRYGRRVLGKRCTADASAIPGEPGSPAAYAGSSLVHRRGLADRLFLSSSPDDFVALAVDDALLVNGADAGLGPYALQPGVPPWLFEVPIERNLVPVPPRDVSALVPEGTSTLLFEAVDLDRSVVGHTPVFLLADCGLIVDGRAPTVLRVVSRDVAVDGRPVDADIRAGALSELRADQGFARAACAARLLANPGTDPLPDPSPGEGRWYLGRVLDPANACAAQGYGDADGPSPDPRAVLDALAACP